MGTVMGRKTGGIVAEFLNRHPSCSPHRNSIWIQRPDFTRLRHHDSIALHFLWQLGGKVLGEFCYQQSDAWLAPLRTNPASHNAGQ